MAKITEINATYNIEYEQTNYFYLKCYIFFKTCPIIDHKKWKEGNVVIFTSVTMK